MEDISKATPRPWKIGIENRADVINDKGVLVVVDNDVYLSNETAYANAALIVQAVNAYENAWKVGGPRCDQCDNGLDHDWAFCPYCGEKTWLVDDPDS